MKAIKKPVEVDFVQLPELNENNTEDFYENIYKGVLEKAIPYIAHNHPGIFYSSDEFDNRRMSLGNPIRYWYLIQSLEGQMTAEPGDYLIYGGHDDVWAVKKEIFEKTYDIVRGE